MLLRRDGDRCSQRLGRTVLRLPAQIGSENDVNNLVHVRNRDKVQVFEHCRVNLGQVRPVVFRHQHGIDTRAESGHGLFFQTANGQHAAAQRNLAGHGKKTAKPAVPSALK